MGATRSSTFAAGWGADAGAPAAAAEAGVAEAGDDEPAAFAGGVAGVDCLQPLIALVAAISAATNNVVQRSVVPERNTSCMRDSLDGAKPGACQLSG